MATDTTTTGDPGDAGLVDWNVALGFFEGDRKMMVDIAGVFLQETPRQMAAILQAIESANAKALRINAHALKGSFRYFGAQQGFELASRLEQAGEKNQLSDLLPLTQELESVLCRVLVVMSDYLQREGSS